MKYAVCFNALLDNKFQSIPITELETEEQAIEYIFSLKKKPKPKKSDKKVMGYYYVVPVHKTNKEKKRNKGEG